MVDLYDLSFQYKFTGDIHFLEIKSHSGIKYTPQIHDPHQLLVLFWSFYEDFEKNGAAFDDHVTEMKKKCLYIRNSTN